MVYLFRGRNQQKLQDSRERSATQVLPETVWAGEPMPSGVPPEDGLVVTISRQFGSGGAEIGRMVARESGLNYIDHEIIDEVAKRLGVEAHQAAQQDEQTAGNVGHILKAIQSSNPFTVNYSTLFGTNMAPAQSREIAYLHLTQRVVLELASEGNAIIIGRGSQFLLHNAPRTLHIYIFAPRPYRIGTIMQHYHIDHNSAEALIEQRDYEHDAYLRHNYGSDGHQPGLYHLLINTSLFPFELAAHFISQALPLAKEIVI